MPRITTTSETNRPIPENNTMATNSDVSERLVGMADLSVKTRGDEIDEKMRAAFSITDSLKS
jgi:hypothetical protein